MQAPEERTVVRLVWGAYRKGWSVGGSRERPAEAQALEVSPPNEATTESTPRSNTTVSLPPWAFSVPQHPPGALSSAVPLAPC